MMTQHTHKWYFGSLGDEPPVTICMICGRIKGRLAPPVERPTNRMSQFEQRRLSSTLNPVVGGSLR